MAAVPKKQRKAVKKIKQQHVPSREEIKELDKKLKAQETAFSRLLQKFVKMRKKR